MPHYRFISERVLISKWFSNLETEHTSRFNGRQYFLVFLSTMRLSWWEYQCHASNTTAPLPNIKIYSCIFLFLFRFDYFLSYNFNVSLSHMCCTWNLGFSINPQKCYNVITMVVYKRTDRKKGFNQCVSSILINPHPCSHL